jgi:hypothetical protein
MSLVAVFIVILRSLATVLVTSAILAHRPLIRASGGVVPGSGHPPGRAF